MKKVSVITTCDPCAAWANVETVDGVTTVSTSGNQTLDVCQPHREELAKVLALLAEWGASSDATVPAVRQGTRRGGVRARRRRAKDVEVVQPPAVVHGAYTCPLCAATPSSHHALQQHFRVRHNVAESEVFGGACPLCAHVSTGKALSRHAPEHNATDVAHLFELAAAAGDPRGVVASRAKAFAEAASG